MFFDFGPPFDFYEIFSVRATENRTSIERITLTPAGDACTQSAKVEMASSSVTESVAVLLRNRNPCTIPEKQLRRELKRRKQRLVFSGAEVSMQVQRGGKERIIRADVLDRDMFDPAADTPENTSWTMQLLARLDKVVGPRVMEQPIFPDMKDQSPATELTVDIQRDLSAGKYDSLFKSAPNRPSDLYWAARTGPPRPDVRLLTSVPYQPEAFIEPEYPTLPDSPTSREQSFSASTLMRPAARLISKLKVVIPCSAKQ